MADYNFTTLNNKKLQNFPRIPVRERKMKTKISVKGNYIKVLPQYLKELVNLETLELSSNKIEHISAVLGKIQNLKRLSLNENQISSLEGIGAVKNLSFLDLEKNMINKIPKELVNLDNLSNLNLAENQLKSFPEEILHLASIRRLNLSGNKIQFIPKEIEKLQNLTHLNLSNTNIDRLPPEISKLKKLKYLQIDGNNLRLPKEYSPETPLMTIEWILKQQEFKKLKTTKAYVFKNFSKPEISDHYQSIFEKFTIDKGIDIVPVERPSDINRDITVIFFIVGYDIHNDSNLIYELIEKCQRLDMNYYILMEEDIIGGARLVNFSKGLEFEQQRKELKSYSNITPFKSYEQLTNFIFSAVNQRAPNIKITRLELQNIGHYEELDIPISENICCMVGENGTGKSTILKAIAIAAIGADYTGIDRMSIENLLRIEEIENGVRKYSTGNIKLWYNVDGDGYSNEVEIWMDDDSGNIKFSSKGAFELSTTGYNLKSLILGFPQIRGTSTKNNLNHSKLNEPHVNDLIPLINGYDDTRLQSFGSWIEQLYFETLKKESELDMKRENIKEWLIIQSSFEIISKFSEYNISFNTVETGPTSEVWINTLGAPRGIPISYLSQGFKVVMGWIGHFIQRLIDSYPVQSPDQVIKSNAILIIDEVDSYLHPKWQAKIVNILRSQFPNAQFIMSTHSPIAVSSCTEGEVIILKASLNKIEATTMTNTNGWLFENIIQEVMGLNQSRDKYAMEKIDRIEELLVKRYSNKISKSEVEELDQLSDQIANLPPADPILTLLNLKSLGNSLTE